MILRWAFLLATPLFACTTDEEDGPPEPPDTVPLTVLEVKLTLDSTVKQGTLRVVAEDPDGPVTIFCGAPFEGAAFDSFIVTRPYADLRFYEQPVVRTECLVSQGRLALRRVASTTVPYLMDRPPSITRAQPPVFYVGTPTPWPHTFADDWGLTTIQVFVAPDTTGPCVLPSFVQDTMAITGQHKDSTLVITVPTVGLHCVVIGTKDDAGRGVTLSSRVNVLP